VKSRITARGVGECSERWDVPVGGRSAEEEKEGTNCAAIETKHEISRILTAHQYETAVDHSRRNERELKAGGQGKRGKHAIEDIHRYIDGPLWEPQMVGGHPDQMREKEGQGFGPKLEGGKGEGWEYGFAYIR